MTNGLITPTAGAETEGLGLLCVTSELTVVLQSEKTESQRLANTNPPSTNLAPKCLPKSTRKHLLDMAVHTCGSELRSKRQDSHKFKASSCL